MRRRPTVTIPAAAATAAALISVLVAASSHALAHPPATGVRQAPAPGSAVAVIGDTPYGAEQLEDFRDDVEAINADPDVGLVLHLGDIKNAGTPCSDEYFAQIRADFDRFEDPLVYTPGDNEWTDCHRADAGGYLPTERLARLRRLFFDPPGTTLGAPRSVRPQPHFPENVRFARSGVQFATLHIPGSNDDRDPWFHGRRGADGRARPETASERRLRRREATDRRAANLKWLDSTFALARSTGAAGVVLATQADMVYGSGAPRGRYKLYIARIAGRARAFGRP